MKILAIETSCDETAAAIIEDGCHIISNVVASQIPLHQKTGGVVPEVASRAHIEKIILVINEALLRPDRNPEHSGLIEVRSQSNIDAIAVTVGPGLIGSLLIGVNTAKALAWAWQKPLIPVNHLEAHLYANWLSSLVSRLSSVPTFPCLHLLVSGGHTMLIWQEDHGKLKVVGQTRDDAAGEAFDKTARLLGLPYPGGPELSKLAQKGNPKAYNFPRAMLNQNNFDFSFSGLKTSVRASLLDLSNLSNLSDLSASVEQAIVDALVEKSIRAVRQLKPKSFALSGGVSANRVLRETIKNEIGKIIGAQNIFIPPIEFCTDNAAMVGAAAAFYNPNAIDPKKVLAKSDLTL